MRKFPFTASLLAHAAAIGSAAWLGGVGTSGLPVVRWQARSAVQQGDQHEAPVPTPVVLPDCFHEVDPELLPDPDPLPVDGLSDLLPVTFEPLLPAANQLEPEPLVTPPQIDWRFSLRRSSAAALPPLAEPPSAQQPPAVAGGELAAEEVPAAPDAAQNEPPEYPLESRRRGEAGTVVVWLEIAADGKVQRAGIQQSSGYWRLDRAAQSALQRWVFQPGTRAGVPVAWRLEQAVVFRVTD